MSDLPAPLIPKDVDLRDFPFMPVDIVRLFNSEFHALSDDAAWRAGVTLWLKSYHQVPAASIPDDDIALARLAELGRDVKAWKKMRATALRGWVKCSDGRLYHPVVAEKAMEGWLQKLNQRKVSAAGNAKRYQQTFDAKPYDDEIERCRAILMGLNPQSRVLAKRLPKPSQAPPADLPTGAVEPPDGTPVDTPDGTSNGTPVDDPGGTPDGTPEDLPSGSQETGTGTGTRILEEETPKPPLGAKVPKPPPTGKGTRIDPGWTPSQADLDYSASKGLNDAETAAQVELFRNHYLGKPDRDGGLKSDWPATWRTWVLKSLEFRARRQGQAVATNGFGGRPTSGVRSAMAGIMAATAAHKEAS